MTAHDGHALKNVAIVVALLVQVGALVWGAATISNSVKNLKEATAELENATSATNANLQLLRERSIEQEVRLRILEQDLGRREKRAREP